VSCPGPHSQTYAGIGSRETPEDVLAEMRGIARRLGALGFGLRTGGADGADEAFRVGANGYPMQIFTPWRGFIRQPEVDARAVVVTECDCYEEALKIAEQYHPNWSACSQGARKLHARNVMQVMGQDLCTYSQFVVCWTKTGGAYGGTGQALRVAQGVGVPVWNLKNPEEREWLLRTLRNLEEVAGA